MKTKIRTRKPASPRAPHRTPTTPHAETPPTPTFPSRPAAPYPTPPATETAAQVAHDMGSPLMILQLFLRRVAQLDDAALQPRCAAATLALERLTGLQDALRRQAAAGGATVAPCDVAQLIRNALGAVTAASERVGLQLVYRGPTHCIARLDRLLIDRVLQNLLSNAAQAMWSPQQPHSGVEGGTRRALPVGGATQAPVIDHGRILVRCAFEADGTLLIDIEDNGCGIPPAHLNQVFDRNFTAGKEGGTGLGLDFCRRALAAHGGTITVRSAVGVGTIFQLRIPAATVAGATPLAAPLGATQWAIALAETAEWQWRAPFAQWQRDYGPETVAIFEDVAPVWASDTGWDEPTLSP